MVKTFIVQNYGDFACCISIAASYSTALLDNLPRWPGLHLRHFNNGQVRLHLYYVLKHYWLSVFLADIWFLMGLHQLHPQIWSPRVLNHIGRLTRLVGILPVLPRYAVQAD